MNHLQSNLIKNKQTKKSTLSSYNLVLQLFYWDTAISSSTLLPPSVHEVCHVNNRRLFTVTSSYQPFKVFSVTTYISRREGSEQRVPFVVLCSCNKQAAAQVCCDWVSVQTGAHQLSDCLRWERWLHSHTCTHNGKKKEKCTSKHNLKNVIRR